MELYPAIDLYQGRVVRLTRGDYSDPTFYSRDPSAVAREWERQGAPWLHVVDLEGAKAGEIRNVPELVGIRKSVKCRLQFGGGLRNLETIESALKIGIDRVVLGTKALDESFLRSALERFGEKIAVGLDVKGDEIQTRGWLEATGRDIFSFVGTLKGYGVKTLICTDIQRDGTLEGPNLDVVERLLGLTPARIILSGGVGSLDDLRKCAALQDPRFEGVIVGRALYEKKFSLKEALEISQRTR